jgi:DNA-binding transcriptional MerR regulator
LNERNKALALTSVLLLMLSLVVGGVYAASADTDQDDAPGSDPPEYMNRWRRGPFVGCLDEEQRQELKESVDAMREEGATFDEIREYVQAYLEELGIECQMPEQPDELHQRPELTDEQLEALRQLRDGIQELRDSGATPGEIKEYLDQKAEELGIELPLRHHATGSCGSRGALGRGRGFFGRREG